MIVFPNAKINIGLNITNKRNDGFHELETVFYPIMLRDVLEVVEGREFTFQSSGIVIPGNSSDNICSKAYQLMEKDLELPKVAIHLHKNIPIGAGLGGGSADASFFISLMNDKFQLGLGVEEMEEYASMLGADCPFFIRNRPVFATGKGDQFEEISLDLSSYFIVLVMPDIHVSTAEAFAHIVPKPSINLKQTVNADIREWKNLILNDFEAGIFSKYPQIKEIKEMLYHLGALYASMSGSGSAVYGIFAAPIKLPDLEGENRVFYGV